MNVEDALFIFKGCLIEPIDNPNHEDENKRKVIEVQTEDVMRRIIGYGKTFESAIINAAINFRDS